MERLYPSMSVSPILIHISLIRLKVLNTSVFVFSRIIGVNLIFQDNEEFAIRMLDIHIVQHVQYMIRIAGNVFLQYASRRLPELLQ